MNSSENSVFNDTMRKFGAPQTIIRQYQHWSVLLRPAQATLGAMVLVAHDPVHAFSELSPDSFTELQQVTAHIETALAQAFNNDKLKSDWDSFFKKLELQMGWIRIFSLIDWISAGETLRRWTLLLINSRNDCSLFNNSK